MYVYIRLFYTGKLFGGPTGSILTGLNWYKKYVQVALFKMYMCIHFVLLISTSAHAFSPLIRWLNLEDIDEIKALWHLYIPTEH